MKAKALSQSHVLLLFSCFCYRNSTQSFILNELQLTQKQHIGKKASIVQQSEKRK